MHTNSREAIDKERRENEERGWGDFRTWAIIITLIAFLLLSGLVIFLMLGNGWAHDWNLGQPAIAPG
ncbi:MAG TPA: hypothetical protein VGM37_06120 [Armatimonadota bacterium]